MSCSPGAGLDLATEGIPRRGDPEAPVYLTVFADPTCPYTKNFLVELERFTEGLVSEGRGDKLGWSIRHLVRDAAANSESMVAARALAAARLQGDDPFWNLLWIIIVMKEEVTWDAVFAYSDAAGLDSARFEDDYDSAPANRLVLDDLTLAEEIDLQVTPSVVLCGKRVGSDPDDLIENLEYLIGK